MIEELKKLRELTETLIGNGYLKDQAEEWGYALDAIPDYIYIINNRFEIKFANRALSERLSISKEDLCGKTSYQVIRGSEGGISAEDWGKTKKTPVSSEIYIDNLAGWFDMTKSPIYTKTNKLIGFICVLQDITETKRAVTQRQHAEDALRESQMKYKLIIDNASDVIWTTDVDLNVTFVNPAVKTLIGYGPEEIIGHNFFEFTSPEDFEFVLSKAEEILSSPDSDHLEFESYILNKDKEKVFFIVNAKSLRNVEGNITGFQGIVRVID